MPWELYKYTQHRKWWHKLAFLLVFLSPLAGVLVNLVKHSAIVSVIAVFDLTTEAGAGEVIEEDRLGGGERKGESGKQAEHEG